MRLLHGNEQSGSSAEAHPSDVRVHVVMPVRNEAAALPEVLRKMPAWIEETIVVDNASDDESGAIAEGFGARVLREERLGYGAACARGLAWAKEHGAEIVVFLDGDGSDDPAEMDALVRPILAGEAELVIGRRRNTRAMLPHQRRGTQLICRLLSAGFGRPVGDLGPFRAVSAKSLEALPLRDRGFGWTAEMQAQAYRAGLSVVEVDVAWRPGLTPSAISGTVRGVLRAGTALLARSLREVVGARWDALTQRPVLRALRSPIDISTREALRKAASRVPAAFSSPNQFLGRQYAGCGALIGAMPRCDFACRGCYLGEDANRVPPLALPAIYEQIDQIRDWLGEGGNLQITDGEMTLRDPKELVAILRRARARGLVPMLMTHGDALLRSPELLERLVRDGGLSEISIHIDTTQRGRRDRRYRSPASERDLDPLRGAFAELIRNTRQNTGRPLEAATTVTVTRENLAGVSDIVRCLLRESDAFKMASFQPVARVGRTLDAVSDHVDVSALWEEIAKGLGESWQAPTSPESHIGWLGHADCSRFVQGAVLTERDHAPRFVPLFDPNDEEECRVVAEALERWGGLTFRLDEPGVGFARALGVLLRDPWFLLVQILPQSFRTLGRFLPSGRLRGLIRWFRGDLRIQYFNLVSHHFMSADELETPIGRERLDLCAFQVPIEGEMRSMCEVNALGLRDRFYERLQSNG